MGAGHTVTALYEVIPVGAANDPFMPKANELRYKRDSAPQRPAATQELLYVKLRLQGARRIDEQVDDPSGTRRNRVT
jgi:hypothetical protein